MMAVQLLEQSWKFDFPFGAFPATSKSHRRTPPVNDFSGIDLKPHDLQAIATFSRWPGTN